MEKCKYCDMPGGVKTFENQVPMPLNGRVQCIDHCIAHLVAAPPQEKHVTVSCILSWITQMD